MHSKSNYLFAFVAEVIGILCAITCCEGWFLGVVDRLSGFWHVGERHDYFLPGEGLMLLAVCGVCVAAAVVLVFRCMALLTQRTIPRRVAIIVSVPSALVGIALYEFMIARSISETVILSDDALLIFAASGAVIGSWISGGRSRAQVKVLD